MSPWLATGWAGEAKLGLGQFKNDHVQKIELQAPLLLSGAGEQGRHRGGDRSQMLLVKVCTKFEDARYGETLMHARLACKGAVAWNV